MDKMKKIIYGIDALLVFGTLMGIFFVTGYATPLVIAPQDDFVTREQFVLFSFERAETLYIDDNLEFTSPEVLTIADDVSITLAPGKYYWKAVGVFASEVRTLTIESEVHLRLRETESGEFEVRNAGNTRLTVDVYDRDSLLERKVLDVDDARETDGTSIVGGEQ